MPLLTSSESRRGSRPESHPHLIRHRSRPLSRPACSERVHERVHGLARAGVYPRAVGAARRAALPQLPLLLHLSLFKSISYLTQSVEGARRFLANDSALFLRLLQLSTNETAFGGLHVLEEIEARWNALWDAYCDSILRPNAPTSSSSSPGGGGRPGASTTSARSTSTGTSIGASSGAVDIVDRLEAVVLEGAGAGEGGGPLNISARTLLAALTQQAESRDGGSFL